MIDTVARPPGNGQFIVKPAEAGCLKVKKKNRDESASAAAIPRSGGVDARDCGLDRFKSRADRDEVTGISWRGNIVCFIHAVGLSAGSWASP